MKEPYVQDNFETEFEYFVNASSLTTPVQVQQKVLNSIHEEMRVVPFVLFSKFALIYVLTTLFVVYICPQFGVSLGKAPLNLMNVFMKWGHVACAALCGMTLVGGVFGVASLILKSQESFWIKKQMPWLAPSLAVLTLGILMILGASAQHIEFILWILFGIAAALLSFELGRKSRVHVLRKLIPRSLS